MGLLPEQLLDLTIWQWNAYCDGYKFRRADELALKIEAAYYEAYWNGYSKGGKKSLKRIIQDIYKRQNKQKKKKPTPIDIDKVSKQFERMEALRKNGWYQD